MGARTFALGKADHGPSAISFNNSLIPTIQPAVAQQMSSILAPITDSTIYNVASIFDPIAITSWPSLYSAWARYSNDKSAVNSLLLMLAVVGCVPLLGSAIKGSRFAIATLRSRAALTAIGKSSNTVQKIKVIAQCFGSASSKWADLVAELAPFSDEIAQQMSRSAGSKIRIVGADLMRDLTAIASEVDRYNSYFKYINYVTSNANQNVQEFLIGRFGPKVSKSIDATLATAALEIEKASGVKLPIVASAPVTITQVKSTTQTDPAQLG